MRQAVMRDQRGDVGHFGLLRPQEFLARGNVKKQIAHRNDGAGGQRRLVAAQQLSARDFNRGSGCSSGERVSSSSRDTDAMEGSASPRNPSVAIESRSFTSASLLVAWRSKASSASSRSMPQPSSASRISLRPPASTSMRNSLAPASSEFSSNSLTTLAGLSTTSPAAILFATVSERIRMRPIRALWHPALTSNATGCRLPLMFAVRG